MQYLYSFLFVGFICLIAQVILDRTKLSPGHITSLFVIIGCFLDIFNIYDKLVVKVGGGALVPITSFGHLLIHGALQETSNSGILGLLMGTFSLTSTGIAAALFFSLIFALIFKPKD